MPSNFDTILVTWKPPETTNGIIYQYQAYTESPHRDCYSAHPSTRQCSLHDIPPRTTLKIKVAAYTMPNDHGQGGGQGEDSVEVEVNSWNGGILSVHYLYLQRKPGGVSPLVLASANHI